MEEAIPAIAAHLLALRQFTAAIAVEYETRSPGVVDAAERRARASLERHNRGDAADTIVRALAELTHLANQVRSDAAAQR